MIHAVKNETAQFLEAFPPETHTFSQTLQFGNSSLTVVTSKLTKTQNRIPHLSSVNQNFTA